MNGWIGVDLDGTLAEYHGWPKDGGIGAPIPAMVERVKQWLAEGKDIRIFTARVWPIGTSAAYTPTPEMLGMVVQAGSQIDGIVRWCREHIGQALPITCVKDYGMITLYDDRCVQVEANTGRLVE